MLGLMTGQSRSDAGKEFHLDSPVQPQQSCGDRNALSLWQEQPDLHL